MGDALSDPTYIRPDQIVRFYNGVSVTTAIFCIVVVVVEVIVPNKYLERLAEFLKKAVFFDSSQNVLICRLSTDENKEPSLSTPISMYQINDRYTQVKPAQRFYLLILPMLVYVLVIIAQNKIISEEETFLRQVNLTISFEEQTKFYQCSNTTDRCISYIFRRENLIDAGTALISWWSGLRFVINKLMFILLKGLARCHFCRSKRTSLPCETRVLRFFSWLSPLLFIPYVISDFREDFGITWYPVILCVILVCCAGASAGADLNEAWMNFDSEDQRLVAYEKQLNAARSVLILEGSSVHQVRPSAMTMARNRESATVVPFIIDEHKNF